MLFLRTCYYFLLISLLGFGSGSVFLLYAYNYFVDTSIITVEQFEYYLTIVEMLPAATSVKMLTLISYGLFGLILTIIALTVFMLPTIFICYMTTKIISKKKYINFLNVLGLLFMPVLGGLILDLALKVTKSSVQGINQIVLVVFLSTFTYYIQKNKIKNTTLIIAINLVIVIICSKLALI